jgi:hypothetical protein
VLVDGSTVGAVTSYTFTNVTANHTISATFIIDAPVAPVLVAPVDVANNISTSPTLSWNASTGAATYHLQVSLFVGFGSTVFDNSAGAGLSQQITGLTGLTTYYWHVNATNGGGTSAYSTTWSFTTGQAPVNLRTAAPFAVLSHASISNTGIATSITGDVGLSPGVGSAITGLTSGQVTGTIYAVDGSGPAGSVSAPGMLTTAKNDADAAYTDAMAAGRGTSTLIAGNLAGQTLYPGLYNQGTVDLSDHGLVILDAQGDSNAVFIIRSAATIITIDNSEVRLVNGARATNVFWAAASAVTLGTNSLMKGTIIAQTFTLNTGARLDGRALIRLTGAASVTLDQNIIVKP